MSTLFSPLMAVIYRVISGVLLFWHAVWRTVLGDGSWLHTDWSWVLGIVLLVLTVRAVLFPGYLKQIRSQRAMQAIQPKVKALQDKHEGDRQRLQNELVELYRTEKANPLMGCLPMFVQVPVFFGLFHVLHHLSPAVTGVRSRTLYGWTLAQFDSASHARLFGAPLAASLRSTSAQLGPLHASGTTVAVVAAALIAVMVVTTFLTSRQLILKTGWADDPQQRMVQRLMVYGAPLSLLVSGAMFPIGVVVYWVVQNLVSLGQQMWVLRRYPVPSGMATAAAGPARDAGPGTSDGG